MGSRPKRTRVPGTPTALSRARAIARARDRCASAGPASFVMRRASWVNGTYCKGYGQAPMLRYHKEIGAMPKNKTGARPAPRLTQPLVRQNGVLGPASWDEALQT